MEGGEGGGGVEASPAPLPAAPPMIAPGTHPTPKRGAVTAAPIPQPTAAPPTAPSVTFSPGLEVQAASIRSAPAVTIVLMAFSLILLAKMTMIRTVPSAADQKSSAIEI